MQLEPRPAPLLQANQQQLGLLSNKVHSQVQPAATPNRAAELEMAVQPLQCSSAPQSDAAVAASEAGQPSAALALTPAATPSAQKEVSLLANPVTLLPSGAPDLRRQAPRVLAGCTGWQWPPQHDAARAHCCRWPFHTRPGEPRSHDLICGKPCQCPPTCCANHGGFVVRASRGLWLPLLWDGADSLLCACRLQRLPLTAATPAQRKRLCMQVCSPFKAREFRDAAHTHVATFVENVSQQVDMPQLFSQCASQTCSLLANSCSIVLTALSVPADCRGCQEGLAGDCDYCCQPHNPRHLPLHVSCCLLCAPCAMLVQPALHCSAEPK